MLFVRPIIKTILLILTTLPFAMAATPGQHLQDKLKQIYTLKAHFVKKLYNKQGRLERRSYGTMAIHRPGKFRWHVKSPSKQLMVTNGEHLWIYNQSLKQATYYHDAGDRLQHTPAELLSRAKLLTNYFTVQYAKDWYYLRPRYGSDMLKMIKMHFHSNKLKRMILIDKLNQRSDLKFSHIQVNQRLPSHLFHFEPPKGVDVIRQS